MKAFNVTKMSAPCVLYFSSVLVLGACRTVTTRGTGTGDSATVDAAAGNTGSGGTGGAVKPRLISITDMGADPDDQQSMIHLLAVSNEFELEGLILSTSCWKKQQSSTSLLDQIIDTYGQVSSNLAVHAPGFPSFDYVKSIAVMGQTAYGMDDVGDGRDSAGSDLIIAAVDRPDSRPVWITCWGGCNTIAQALWKVQHTRSSQDVARFAGKLRIYDVLGQDNAGTWIAKTFPDMLYIRATYGVFGWTLGDAWLSQHIQNRGPLGAIYPSSASEGDSPSFFHVYPTGLNDPEKVEQGSWGGRFAPVKKTGIRGMPCMAGEDQPYDPYEMYGDAPEGQAGIKRWSTGINNDLEARMIWSTTSQYSAANHHPIAVVNGDASRQVLTVTAAPGAKVELTAAGSRDPDGNTLTYSWSFYSEPSSYRSSVLVENGAAETATVDVPSDAGGTTIHVIVEIHDDGSPNLYSYRRIIINVQG